MFRYEIVRETPANGGLLVSTLLRTSNKENLKEYIEKELGINPQVSNIEKEIKKVFGETYKEITHFDPFTPFTYKKNLTPELYLKIEYFPIDLIIKEIEKETGKSAAHLVDKSLRNLTQSTYQLIVKAYDPLNKKDKAVFTYSKNKPNSNRVEKLLNLLVNLKKQLSC
ncbi:hypothetical protein [Persephonella sp.]